MPITKSPLSRLREINSLFNQRISSRSASITSREIMERFGISERQLRKDFNALRDQGAPLYYDAKQRGHRYTQAFVLTDDAGLNAEEISNLNLAAALLEQVSHLDAFKNVRSIIEKLRRAMPGQSKTASNEHVPIYFTPVPQYAGTAHLSLLYQAIQQHRQVEFLYQPFHKDTPDQVLLDPYFLREYDQRWYVGGYSHAQHEGFIRTYPLERVAEKPVMRGFFHNKPPGYDPTSYWRDIFGISRPPNAVAEEVQLAFHPVQGRYFQSKPFFEPYTILEDCAERLVVQMKIVVNQELIGKLASMGDRVQVLKPKTLVNRLHKFLEDALQQVVLSNIPTLG